MALRTNTADGGTIGTAISTANSGGASGTAWSAVTTGTGGTITYSNVRARTGALSSAITAGTGSNCYLRWNPTASGSCVTRAYFYFTGATTGATQLVRFLNGSTVTMANIFISLNGANQVFGVQDSIGTLYEGTATVPLNTWLRFELAQSGLSTTAGVIAAAVYVNDATSPLDSFSTSVANVTTSGVTQVYYGKASNAGNWATMYLDDVALIDGASTFIGPARYGSQLNNYQFVSVGDGMGTVEKVR